MRLFKKKYPSYAKEKSAREEAYEGLNKLENDVWPNFVLLNNGKWIVGTTIAKKFKYGNQVFLEIEIMESYDCKFLEEKYGKENNLEHFLLRNYFINLDEIAAISEFAS